jgi:hypothetical protein
MSATLILLNGEVFCPGAFNPASGRHDASSKPALAAADAPMKSRRVMGCFTIF